MKLACLITDKQEICCGRYQRFLETSSHSMMGHFDCVYVIVALISVFL